MAMSWMRLRSREVVRGLFGAAAAGALAASSAGCLQILGDEGPFVLADGGGGTGAAGGTGGMTGGGGTASTCEPAKAEACYEGPEGTVDQGVCKGGMHTCGQDGTWGVCEGQVLPGVETCASKDDEDCDNKECARWSLISVGDGSMGGTALTTDSDGNTFVTGGVFDGQALLGDKVLDGPTKGAVFLAKLDPAGNPQWAKAFGGSDLQFGLSRSIACDAAGNVLMAGVFAGTLDIGGSSRTAAGKDLFVAKFTPGGALAWLSAYGGDMDQQPWDAALTTNGDMLVTGTYDNGFLINGTSASGGGALVVRLSPSNGNVMSVKHFNPLVGESVNPVLAAGPNGTWALAGQCSDGATIEGKALPTCNYFVSKFAEDDSAMWVVSVPTMPTTVALTTDGSVLIAGHFSGTVDFDGTSLVTKGLSDIFVARLAASDGSIQWVVPFGGPGDDLAPRLVVDSQDRSYVTFEADDKIDFGGGLLGSAGLADTFVLALDPAGAHRWSRIFGDSTSQSGTRLAVRGGDAGLIVSVNAPGEIDFGAGPLQATATLGLAIADLGP